ncbi:ABC transporter permease [Bacillaceae bacterium SIJ1]|uniref:ABC transporter permease n=1 Tax=Litoribacterium kuwaitense TaxID=1398745 RepID=UPI0013EB24B6|nr:ABC transporter permease [Litoribacterium kuwaitense]NGP44805.1 ABC transporter permease [Litoribacterium kuwaitense]
MRRLLSLSWLELSTLRSHPLAWVALALVPPFFFVGVLLFAASFFASDHDFQVKTALVDEDDSLETRLAIKQLFANEALDDIVNITKVDQAKAANMLASEEVAAVIRLPVGFGNDVSRGMNTPVEVTGHADYPLEVAVIRYIMESATSYISAAQSAINTTHSFLTEYGAPREQIQQVFQQNVFSYGAAVINRGQWFQKESYDPLYLSEPKTYYSFSVIALVWLSWAFGTFFLLQKTHSSGLSLRLRLMNTPFWMETLCRLFVALLFNVIAGFILWGFVTQVAHLPLSLGAALLGPVVLTLWFACLKLLFSDSLYVSVGTGWVIISLIASGFLLPVSFLPDWLEWVSQGLVTSHILSFMHASQNDETFLSVSILSWGLTLSISYAILTVVTGRRQLSLGGRE